MIFNLMSLIRVVAIFTMLSACSPVSGPDKSAAGAILGGGLGAGSGAIIGNQAGMPGAGVAIGAGMAAAAGLASGIGLDIEEGYQLKAHRQLENIKNVNKHNRTRLAEIEARERYVSGSPTNTPAFLQVFFDEKRASLKVASALQIQHVAEVLRGRRYGTYLVELKGYSTDFQAPEENKEVITARVASVKASLVSHGIPENFIKDNTASALGKSPIEYDKSMEQGILLKDRSEPMNRYNNRVEIFIKY